MAIETLFADGFDSYTAEADMDDYSRWEDTSPLVSGRSGGQAIQHTTANYNWNYVYTQEPKRLFIVGFAFKTGATPLNGDIASLGGYGYSFDATNVGVSLAQEADFRLRENASGYLEVYRWSNYVATGTTYLQRDTWYYIEFRCFRDNTNGTYEVRINETTELSGSSLDFQNTGATNTWGTLAIDGGIIDDLYIRGDDADTAGGWFGDVRVLSMEPTSNGTNRDWSPSTGTDDYAVVDEMPISASDYLSSATSTDKVSLNYDDLATGYTVKSVVHIMAMRTDPVGAVMSYKPLCYSSSNYLGTAAQVPDSIVRYACYDTDPNTSAAWTLANFNAAEFGLELQ